MTTIYRPSKYVFIAWLAFGFTSIVAAQLRIEAAFDTLVSRSWEMGPPQRFPLAFVFQATNRTRFDWLGFSISIEEDPNFPNEKIDNVSIAGHREVCVPILGCGPVGLQVKRFAEEGEKIRPGRTYILPPGHIGAEEVRFINPDNVHFRFRAQPLTEPPVLGAIALKHQATLDNGGIPDELRQVLAYRIDEMILPQNDVAVERVKAGEWLIIDKVNKQGYRVKREEALNIYEAGTVKVPMGIVT